MMGLIGGLVKFVIKSMLISFFLGLFGLILLWILFR